MNIFFIGQKGISIGQGGPEKHVEELASFLVDKGNQVYVYTRPQYMKNSIGEKGNYRGINLISLPTIKTKHLDASIHSLLASVHVLFKPADIINYQAIGPAFFSFIPKFCKKNVKIIVTNHGLDWQRNKWGLFAKLFLLLAEKVSVYTADQIVCVSKETANYYKDKYEINAAYIPNGVKKIKPASKKSVKQYRLKANEYILFLARLVPEKGCHYLIQAFKKIKTDKKLVIAGASSNTDEYARRLKALAGRDKRIVFTGNISGNKWNSILSNAYLVVQPSNLEAASFSILEAMSLGRPVLVSDIKDNISLINNKGYYFKTGDIFDLKEKLEHLLNNKNKICKAGLEAKKFILKKYNWQDIGNKFLNVYQLSAENKIIYRKFKRIFDLFFALIVLIASLPIMLLITVLIKIDSRGPLFFIQKRIGKNCQPFHIYKFRTMHIDQCRDGYSPKDYVADKRVTRTGKFLRITCLDELPQLINIIKGEMSLVGPRPEQWILKDRYQGRSLERFKVMPGLSGLWQISGKKNEEIFEHLEYDLAYCEKKSVLYDLKIIVLTPWAVIKNVCFVFKTDQKEFFNLNQIKINN